MRVKRIEHVGVVVKDLAQSRAVWEECLGLRLAEVEELPQYEVRIGMYPVGESMVELLQGTRPDGTYARLAREGKEGLHHLCLEVEDLEGALAELRGKGVRLRDETPRPGHQGSRIAFLDPASTGNVLVELVQRAGEG